MEALPIDPAQLAVERGHKRNTNAERPELRAIEKCWSRDIDFDISYDCFSSNVLKGTNAA
jgi:hypothetical protein